MFATCVCYLLFENLPFALIALVSLFSCLNLTCILRVNWLYGVYHAFPLLVSCLYFARLLLVFGVSCLVCMVRVSCVPFARYSLTSCLFLACRFDLGFGLIILCVCQLLVTRAPCVGFLSVSCV